MDKVIEALRGILASLGLDDVAIESVVQQLSALAIQEAGTEENPENGNPVEEQVPADVPLVPPTDVVDEGGSDVPPNTELPPEENPAPVEEIQQVPPTSDVPPVPPFDPTELIARLDEVVNVNEELKKANEGLLARVQALEEALKTAGVIEGNNTVTEVGDSYPTAAPQSPTDDVLGSVLSELNGHKRF